MSWESPRERTDRLLVLVKRVHSREQVVLTVEDVEAIAWLIRRCDELEQWVMRNPPRRRRAVSPVEKAE